MSIFKATVPIDSSDTTRRTTDKMKPKSKCLFFHIIL